jgi:hypothetical protein
LNLPPGPAGGVQQPQVVLVLLRPSAQHVHPIVLDRDPAFKVNPDQDPIRIQGFYDQKLKKKNTAEHFFHLFFKSKIAIYGTYVQATGEDFSPQKRTSSSSKKLNLLPFFYVCGSFLPSWIRIRIRIQHWFWKFYKIM